MGDLQTPLSLTEFLSDLKARLAVATLDFVGPSESRIKRVAIACGAAAEFMDDAIENGCDRPAICVVSTDVAPEPIQATVPARQRVELVTFRGSPASAFKPKVECKVQ